MVIRNLSFFLVLSLLFPIEGAQKNLFQWTHQIETKDAVIITKSLKWLEVPKERMTIQVLSVLENQFIIYCQGNILIPRYGRGELVEAEFDLKIKGQNQTLVIEISSLEVFMHDRIIDDYIKKQEINMIKEILKTTSNNLAQFITNNNKKFMQYFQALDR